jgi:hypothetical protein
MMPRKNQPPSIEELALNLSQAHTLRSVADTVGLYCGKKFGCPAGMIFVERQGHLELVSAWRSKDTSAKNPPVDMMRKGPIIQAFRTGEPVFLPKKRVAFLPIGIPKQPPVGVMALVLP